MRGKRRSSRKAKRKARFGETISRAIRRRHFYTIPEAGAKVDLSRSGCYRAARLGKIGPIEVDGKFQLVRREQWDREVERLLRGATLIEA